VPGDDAQRRSRGRARPIVSPRVRSRPGAAWPTCA